PKYDKPYFYYIKNLIKNLFRIEPKINITKNNLLVLTVSSKELCEFIHKKFNLPYGNKIKNKIKIPTQIIKDKILIKACLRGLIDTDGFIGKSNNRLKIIFTSYNKGLLRQVALLNRNLGFSDKYYKNNNIEICSKYKIISYLNTIGSSNIRHIIRFKEMLNNNKLLYKEEVLGYYSKYSNLKLPCYGSVV
ncbi:unnamed protein product, partial [marine sediment metagenome]